MRAVASDASEDGVWLILYDERCDFCKWLLAGAIRWDRTRRLRPLALGDVEASELLVGLTPEERFDSWHLISPAGTRSSAGAAFAPLLGLLPGGGPIASLLRSRPMLAERAYRSIADRRALLSRAVPAWAKRRAGERVGERERTSAPPGASRPGDQRLVSIRGEEPMPRLPYRDPETAPEPIRRVIADTPLALLRVIAHADTAFEPWLRYSNVLLRELQLDPLLRELAILQVAHLSSSAYEWTQHVPIAESFGAPAALVAAIESGEEEPDPSLASSEQRAVLAFTREVIVDGAAGEQAVAALRETLGERSVVELLLVIGNYMGLARLIATVGLEPHEPVVKLPGGTEALGPRQ